MIRDSEELRKKCTLYNGWKEKYAEYDRLIKDIEHEESKIPGTFPEVIKIGKGKKTITIAIPRTHGDPKNKETRRLELIDYKESLIRTRDDYGKKIAEVDEAMRHLPADIKHLVELIYVWGWKAEEVASQYNLSKTGLLSMIERKIKENL